MKFLAPLGLALILIAVSAIDGRAQGAGSSEVLTNESIINLARAKFKESTILTLIRTSETKFDISTPKLVELKKRGVSERVISEIISRTNMNIAVQRSGSLKDDEFFSKDDEAFFKGSSIFKELPSERDAKRRENEAQIFGGQSGSKSGARSRGMGPNGSRQDQSEVLGSASVRIIRPGESSGAEPKLERAVKLDNKGVLDMVQAGFTEGTVIRKIESSQVDFDLSPKGLSGLRQNRVSEKVIKAMTTAMEESK